MIKDYELKHLLKANIEDFALDIFSGKTANGLAESLQTMNEIVDRFVDKYKPEPVKPVLPKAVADEMEKAKENKFFDIYIQRVIGNNPDFYPHSSKYWYNHDGNNTETLLNAWNNGYMVETEKKYNLILDTDTDGDTSAFFKNNPCTEAVLWLDTDTYADDLKRDKFYQFTQEEIDKFNKDFWIKNIDLNDYKVEVNIDD